MNVHKDYIYLGLGEPDPIHFTAERQLRPTSFLFVQPKAVKQGRNRFCRGTLALWRKLHALLSRGIVRGTRQPHKLDQRGATPRPATNHPNHGIHGATLTASADERPLQCGSRDFTDGGAAAPPYQVLPGGSGAGSKSARNGGAQ